METKNREYMNTYNLKRYHRLKASGICVRCQKQPARKGKTQCDDCSKKVKFETRLSIKGKVGSQLYFQLYQDQGGKCKICQKQMLRPVLDHCHETGEIRGLLCSGCNSGLGFFKDDPVALRAAAHYVQFSRVDEAAYLEKADRLGLNIKEENPVVTKTGYIIVD